VYICVCGGGMFTRSKKGRSKMDYEKLHELSGSVRTWAYFLLENGISLSKIACNLSHGEFEHGYVLRSYKNELYYLRKNMEDLIEKYNELEKFCNENNIEGE
jgi:hypothetical protein